MSNKARSDQELCRLVVNNNEQAFCELYIRYKDRLVFFCQKFVKKQEIAEDIAQNIFEKLWEDRKNILPELSFSSYIFTIARNKVLNFLRQLKKETKVWEEISTTGNGKIEGFDLFVEAEYKELLGKAIENLTPQRRKVFQLSREEGKTHLEIANLLDISIYTVQEHISESLKLIKRYMSFHADLNFH
ncbi:MAG TPA: RNA polymerase sigma-70 factor [Bacteroidales bacterium]